MAPMRHSKVGFPTLHVAGDNSQLTSFYCVVVSRAFQILSDSDKKSRYDKFGGDPDSRFPSSGAGPSGAGSPFSGFGGGGFPRGQPAGGPAFEEEISPEELFNRFFGGGFTPMGGGGFSPFGETHITSYKPAFFFSN